MTKEQISEIQKTFPKFSKVAASLANRPDETGIVLSKKALKIIAESDFKCKDIFTDMPNEKPKIERFNRGKRRKPNRLTVYLDNETFEKFNSYKKSMNMTTQDYLMSIIKEELYNGI